MTRVTTADLEQRDRVVIVGGGPGGYEAALVAAQLGAEVTVVDCDGLGGSAVLTDCVPSKTLIATSELMTDLAGAPELGVGFEATRAPRHSTWSSTSPWSTSASSELAADAVRRHRAPARAGGRPHRAAVRAGCGAPGRSWSTLHDGGRGDDRGRRRAAGHGGRTAHAALRRAGRRADPHLGAGLRPRRSCPTRLVVVGSGVTGAEFASAYMALGIDVVLVSSRDRVLPGEDADAAAVLEDVLTRRGMEVLSRSRMESVSRSGDEVTVTPHRRPHRHRLPLPAGARLGAPHRRASASRRPAWPSTRRVRQGRPGLAVRRPAGSTPPVTARAC